MTNEKGESELSIYSGELTNEVLTKSIAKVKAAFPSLTPAFFDVLIERVKAKGFTDEKLTDAIQHLIDTCPYPTPALANILSFDKRVKILTYHELCSLITKFEATFEAYAKIKINGKMHYVKKSDKSIYNIPDQF